MGSDVPLLQGGMMRNDPKQLIANYRMALEGVYGKEIADKSHIDYYRGWYYINVARQFSDGSVGTLSWASHRCFRAKELIQRTHNLVERANKGE